MATGQSEITLRFLAAPTDVATLGGSIHGGRVLEWIDKAAYALVVGWSGRYCVTAYVGDIRFTRPIESGNLVEVTARLMRTGRSSMDVHVTVSSADPQDAVYTEATTCVVVFVAVDAHGKSTAVVAVVAGDRTGPSVAGRRAGAGDGPPQHRERDGRADLQRRRHRAGDDPAVPGRAERRELGRQERTAEP